MIASWRLPLLTVMTGTLLIASAATTDVQRFDGPIITPSVNEYILQAGQNFTLNCKGKSPVQFKQQEQPEVAMEQFYMEQRNIPSVNEFEYEVELTLYNVDRDAIGYYACFDGSVSSTDVLSEISEEPNNTAHISYIYIFVNDSSMFAPMRALVIAKSDSKFIIECRPTTPDIKVKLTSDFADVEYDRYNPKVGFTLDGDVVSTTSIFNCSFVRYDHTIHKEVVVYKHVPTPPAVPTIFGGSQCFLEGEIFSVNCTVNVIRNVPVDLAWTIPGSLSKVTNSSNGYKQRDLPLLFNNYTIHNATAEDAGTYVCTAKNGHGAKTATVYKKYLEKPVIIMEKRNQKGIIETNIRAILLRVDIFDYPPVDVVLYRDNNPLYIDGGKVNVSLSRDQLSCSAKCYIKIKPLLIEDTANYTLVATNKLMSNNVTFDLRVRAPPTVDFGPDTDRTYVIGTQATLICEVTGYPLPQVDWIFSDDEGEQVIDKKFQDDTADTVYKLTSLLTIKAHVSGNIACQATNTMNSTFSSRNFFVYELPGGFGIKERDRTWFWQGQRVILTCLASKYDFTNVTWFGFENESIPEDKLNSVSYSSSPFSHIATLKIDQITLNDAGGYVCVGQRNDDTEENETTTVTVAEIQEPEIKDQEDLTVEVLIYHAINFTCTASAIPPPVINWYKGAEVLRNLSDDNMFIKTSNINQSTRYSIVKIEQMQEENVGTYECRAISNGVIQSKFYNLQIKERPSHKATYLSVIGVIFFVLILLVVYLTWKIRKEKQFRKELAAAGLLNFKEGVTKSINPDLGIDEQAELLPYDEKFEFPVDKLILGKQLGAGAFGVVYKADARGIVNAELTTTVAVKMVKKTADNMYIKALASELKIMVHLGKHINIVNLLGACTKNVGKRELLVIVEYCKYGNIHNYMQKHREVFIDQFTDNPEKNFGKINRGYSCSSGNSGLHSDYFGSNHTQDTDHTFLNTANTNRSGRKDPKQVEFIKVSETGYVQPEWRSNYESDYSFDGRSPRPLCSRDLLAWAFQIARGMEYLASRKVLHGDLAARNVLLADDNIVKICDFGLARSIYKNDEYQKQENSPLPVKWLAIECMTDRIFSTQSDVWSFGIVLWELFSLAKTPYPNVSPPSLLQWLSEGRRLEKPSYADDKLYELMLQCWQQKPTSRPSFSQLQQILGSFLEDNVRNHYVDLNASYLDMNIRREGEDYLAMVNAPDYNNMITPSPHHYMNDARSFFPATPTQLQHDDEGYLQMSPATRQTIFNARAQGTKFDFDARKLAPRASEPSSHGSELTPMLTLNNLPRSGSESDHEGNSSPYLNMCPRIEEETDEVFEMRQNAKNIQPTAVTNPTYITFSADDEKKPPNFSNDYINVPNGLVK